MSNRLTRYSTNSRSLSYDSYVDAMEAIEGNKIKSFDDNLPYGPSKGSPTAVKQHITGVESKMARVSTTGTGSVKRLAFGYTESRLSRKQKVKRHWQRFRCCYLLGGIVFLAIILPLFFLVILPAIVQDLVSKSDLPILGGTFLAHSPDSAIVSLSTELDIPSGIKASIDPFTLYIFNRNTTPFTPFLGVALNKTYLDGRTQINITDEVVTVTDQTQMELWLTGVFNNAKTAVSVRGEANVHIGALHDRVSIDKTATIDSLRRLEGFSFDTLELVLPADADGTNIKGNLTLPNWSPLTVGLGNVTLNVFSGTYLVGIANLYDVVIPPGNQTLNYRGQLFIDYALQNIPGIIASQASALQSGNIEITASGNASVVDGQHIGWVENVLNAQRLTAQVPIFELVGQVAGQILGNSSDIGDALSDLLDSLRNITEADEFDY